MALASLLPRPKRPQLSLGTIRPPGTPIWRSPATKVWSSTPAGGRVLIVDDDRSLLSLLSVIFRAAGFEVTTASGGATALEALRTGDPEVIVLDLEMPGMNGREFYRALRAANNTTPVLILSAYNARSAQLELGAQAYTSKPFDPDQLIDSVRRLLEGSADG